MSNNNMVQNYPSEIFYVYDNDKKRIWSLNSGVIPNDNYYYITFGFGYSKYRNVTDDNSELLVEEMVENEQITSNI